MSIASQVNAYRPLGVLLGGPFAPQRSIEPKPLVCALLRGRTAARRRFGSDPRIERLGFRRSCGHGRPSWLTATAGRSPPWSSNWPRTIRSS